MHARIWFSPQIFVGLQEDLKTACEVFFAEERRGLCQCGALVRRGGNHFRVRAAGPRDQEIAHVPHGLAAEVLQVAAFFLEGVHQAESAVCRAFRDCADEFLSASSGTTPRSSRTSLSAMVSPQ